MRILHIISYKTLFRYMQVLHLSSLGRMVRGREYQDRRPPRLEMLRKNTLLLDSPLSIEVVLKTKDGPQPQEKKELWRQMNTRKML